MLTIRCRRDGPDGPRPELKRHAIGEFQKGGQSSVSRNELKNDTAPIFPAPSFFDVVPANAGIQLFEVTPTNTRTQLFHFAIHPLEQQRRISPTRHSVIPRHVVPANAGIPPLRIASCCFA